MPRLPPPVITVPLYAGAVADSVDRRKLLLYSDIALLLVTVGLLANALLPSPSVAFLFAAEVLATGAYGFQRPERNALIPRLVSRDLFSAAIAVEDVVFNLARGIERASFRSIADGFRYVREKRAMLGIFLVDTNAMVFGMPSALFPASARSSAAAQSFLLPALVRYDSRRQHAN
jgi:Transmembrane secretion effector